MAQSFQPDDISSLARRLAEQIAVLCPNVPTNELSDVSSRLALKEIAHAAGVAVDNDAESKPAMAPAGNRVVWLPGSSASAIVLPAGEEQPRAGATAAQLMEWARRYRAPINGLAVRGSAALRQIGSALVSAYQARPRVQ